MKKQLFLLIFICYGFSFKTKAVVISNDISSSSFRRGDVTLVSIQYKFPIISWDKELDRPKELFLTHVIWKKGYESALYKSMPANLLNKVSIVQFDKNDLKKLRKKTRGIDTYYTGYPYNKALLLDDNQSGDYLDESILDFLNKNVNSHYYMTIILKVDEMHSPGMVNKFTFSTKMRVIFVIYNRAGKKVLLKSFRKSFKKSDFKDADYVKIKTYMNYFMIIIKENNKNINNLFSHFYLKTRDNKKKIVLKNYFQSILKKGK